MELTFLGCGAAFYPVEGNTSAILRDGDHALLIDAGETVFERLMQRDILQQLHSLDICLTHLHCDHSGSLGTLVLYCNFACGFVPRLILPENEDYRNDVRTLLRIAGCRPQQYSILAPAEVSGYRAFTSVKYVPTVHAPGMPAFSLVFETPEGGVFYSGDSAETAPLEAFLAAHPAPERLYLDSTDADFPGNVHLSLRLIRETVPPQIWDRVTMIHVNAPSCVQKGLEYGFGFGNI